MSVPAIVWIVAGYLVGSIPFGLILARANGIDIRAVGSGNIGATNVLRTGSKWLAAATLLLDGGKGAAAVLLTRHFVPGDLDPTAIFAGLAAFVGHIAPVWLRFRGGKGVATMLGVTLTVVWPLGIVALLVWLTGALVTRYSSVGGMMAALAAPVCLTAAAVASGGPLPLTFNATLWATWAMAVMLVWKHAENLARLRAGTESRIGGRG